MDILELKLINQCRVCLEYDELMFNIFEDSSTAFKIEQCCGVEIVNIPTMSGKICKKCFDILNVAYDFRVLCQRSQEYLCHQQLNQDLDEHKPTLSEIDLGPYISMDEEDVIEEYVQDDVKCTNGDEKNNGTEILREEADEQSNAVEKADKLKGDDKVEDDEKSDSEEKSDFGDKSDHGDKSDLDDKTDFGDKSDYNEKDGVLQVEKTKPSKRKAFKTRGPRPKPPQTFMCNYCGNLYTNKQTFNYHMKLHVKDKKYECEICKKRFMQTCELRAHIRTHTGEKPFKCHYCDRSFRDRSGVTRHERTHTNERPYGCELCGASFTYSATLKKHERVHTGEKPFKCMICNKVFSEQHQLKAHTATNKHRVLASQQNKFVILFSN